MISEAPSPRVRLLDFFSVKDVFALRNVIIMGLMAALTAVLSRFTIYISPTQKFMDIAYLPGAVIAMLYGPWAALGFGFVSDTVGYFANPQGVYFFGYAVSKMVSLFIYACFFYKQRVTLGRAIAARALVLVIVVFGLNFVWQSIMMGQLSAAYFTSTRLVLNAVQFPFHVALILLLGKPAERIKTVIQKD